MTIHRHILHKINESEKTAFCDGCARTVKIVKKKNPTAKRGYTWRCFEAEKQWKGGRRIDALPPEPKRILNITELAWAAGAFEGEGCIYISKYDRQAERGKGRIYYALHCSLNNTQKVMPRLFHQAWPGRFSKSFITSAQTQFVWEVPSERALKFLTAIEPYVKLGRNHKRIDVARRFEEARELGDKEAQHLCYLEMKKLNRRGIVK